MEKRGDGVNYRVDRKSQTFTGIVESRGRFRRAKTEREYYPFSFKIRIMEESGEKVRRATVDELWGDEIMDNIIPGARIEIEGRFAYSSRGNYAPRVRILGHHIRFPDKT
jgi:hypothetical protein